MRVRTRIEGQLAEDSYLFREICAKIAILPKIAIFRERERHLGARGPAGDDIGTHGRSHGCSEAGWLSWQPMHAGGLGGTQSTKLLGTIQLDCWLPHLG